mgnify:CR=1 FL=1
MLIELRKGIVIGLLLTSLYGIGAYIYKNQMKNKSGFKNEINKKKDNIQNSKNRQYIEIDDYKHKKSSSTFVKRSLGYEKRFSKTASLKELEKELKDEYCTAVKEIKKVDQKIVPGTNLPFRKATEVQIENAYKEYLQKIAQIRQVFDTIYGNDNDLENGTGCHYTGTHWNNANSQYKAKQFYDRSIIKYLNNHGYGIKNNASSTLKRKEKKVISSSL